MPRQTLDETERSKVVLSEVFAGTNLVVESPAVPVQKQGEVLLIFGETTWVRKLLSSLPNLLGHGDDRYFWNGLEPIRGDQILLSMLETGLDLRLPRLELVQRLFLLDILRYCDIAVSPVYRLTVLTPSGSILHTALVETPKLADGQ